MSFTTSSLGLPSHRILSQPIGVEWAGWKTDTTRLQNCGWDLAVNFNFNNSTYQLLMQHPDLKLTAYTNEIFIDSGLNLVNGYQKYNAAELPLFQVRHVAPNFITKIIHAELDFSKFQQIDAQPQLITEKQQRMEDFNIFALARNKSQEIIIDKARWDVIHHLEAIKQLQEPKQRELREQFLNDRARESSGSPKSELVAQLIHIDRAA